jgi:uncharacterized membrane protein
VIWDTNTGEVTDLGVMNRPKSVASAINAFTEVIGWTGVSASTGLGFFHQQQTLVLPPIPGGISSVAFDLTREAIIVGGGTIEVKGQPLARAAIWDEKWTTVIDPPDGFTQIAARHVNDLNQILMLATLQGGIARPYLWQHGEMDDLNSLKTSGPLLTHPSDINNQGQILARASTLAVLLTPIDVPLADLNYDCKVDGHDLVILLNSWGPQSIARSATGVRTHPADLNGDGVVDGLDLLILLANWNP